MTEKASDSLVEAVGLVGLGLMGAALAERLLAGGLRVVGYDVDPQACRALGERGGDPSPDLAFVFDRCDRVLLSLPHSGVVKRVLGDAGNHLRSGQVVIDTSTGDPADAAALGEKLAGRGVDYLDATISGNSDQVRAAEVTVMAGGEPAAFERCRDLFAMFARRAFHVGPWGGGATMKLVTNLVLGLNRAALAEGLSFARALGLDLHQTLGVLRESMAYSRIMDAKGERMIRGQFDPPQAKLSQHLKDVRLMLESAAAVGAELPLSRVHRELLERAEAAGYGGQDNSALIRAFEPAPAGRGRV